MRCNEEVTRGLLIRCILTVFLFYFIKLSDSDNSYYKLFPLLSLVFLDLSDSFLISTRQIDFPKNKKCTHKRYYQLCDKILDIATYILFYLLFIKDNPQINGKNRPIIFTIIIRIFGVLLFGVSRNTEWLIVFFDFFKEYLLYSYFFESDKYVPVLVFLKVCFEYYFHKIHINHK